jgi:hypothetical protein
MQDNKVQTKPKLIPLRFRVYSVLSQDPGTGWLPIWVFFEGQDRRGCPVIKKFRQSADPHNTTHLETKAKKLEDLSILNIPGKLVKEGQFSFSGILTTSVFDEDRLDPEREDSIGPQLLDWINAELTRNSAQTAEKIQ